MMQGTRSQPQPVERVLAEVQQELARAWVTGDRATVERLIAPDWTAVGPTGAVTTRTELFAPIFEQHIQHINQLEIDLVHARVFGDTAVVTGRTHTVGSVGGTAYDVRLRFTDVFVRRSGQWQAVASHASLLHDE